MDILSPQMKMYSTERHNHLFFIVGTLTLSTNARWSQNGVTVAGGNGYGNAVNQLSSPSGLDIDDDNQSIVIAEWGNGRIVEWKINASKGVKLLLSLQITITKKLLLLITNNKIVICY